MKGLIGARTERELFCFSTDKGIVVGIAQMKLILDCSPQWTETKDHEMHFVFVILNKLVICSALQQKVNFFLSFKFLKVIFFPFTKRKN